METNCGSVHGGFVSHHRFIDLTAPQPKVALKETWRVAIYNVGTGQKRYRMFDWKNFGRTTLIHRRRL